MRPHGHGLSIFYFHGFHEGYPDMDSMESTLGCCTRNADDVEISNELKDILKLYDNTTPKLCFDGIMTLIRVTDVYDGDTITAVIKSGHSMFRRFQFRLIGIDTPEIRSRNSIERTHAVSARNRVLNWLLPDVFAVDGKYTHRTITAQLDHTPAITRARLGNFDKYGRILCRIVSDDGDCLNDVLIKEGFARAYDGGNRKKWSFETT